MKAPVLALRICAGAVVALGAAGLGAACLVSSEVTLLQNEPFDGAFLEACADGATHTIPASDCPFCSGKTATAICVGGFYAECSCMPSTALPCDAGPGCCADPSTGYVPTFCKGNVVQPDPSEGLCPSSTGYLVCNGTCFSTFSCDIPKGFMLEDAGRDAGRDGGHVRDAGRHDASDAPSDAADGAADGADGSSGDGAADVAPSDGPLG